MPTRKRTPASRFGSPSFEYILIIGASLLLSWLLSLAFPYGITTEETTGYFAVTQGFSWTAQNLLDWWRTPFLGFVYKSFIHLFANPSIAMFWLHAGVSALNLGLILALCRKICATHRTASAIAWTYLAVEVLSMRSFYFDTQIASDTFYGRFGLLAVLLIICGWLYRKLHPVVLGYAVIGALVAMRSAGLALLPIWIPFAFIACRMSGAMLRTWLATAALCIAVTLTPVLLWSGRNAMVYGQFRPTAYASFQLLSRALPLLKDNDRIFDDQATNERFIATVRAFEERIDIRSFDHMQAWGRIGRHNIYFPWDNVLPPDGPFRFLRDAAVSTMAVENEGALNSPQNLFSIDSAAFPVAIRIIEKHPLAYVKLVVQDYLQLFDVSQGIQARKAEVFTPNAADSYDQITTPAFYPPNGHPDLSRINAGIRNAWWIVTQNDFVLAIRKGLEQSMPIAVHIIAFIACWLLFMHKRTPLKSPKAPAYASVLTLLFATAALHNLLVSISQPPMYRFCIPSAGIANLIVLLGIAAVLPTFPRVVSRCYSSSDSLTRIVSAATGKQVALFMTAVLVGLACVFAVMQLLG